MRENLSAKGFEFSPTELMTTGNQSHCPVKPIFVQTYPIFGWTNIDYILSL